MNYFSYIKHSSPAGHFMVGDCDHHFLWTSASACPLTDTSDGGGSSDISCKVTNPATGIPICYVDLMLFFFSSDLICLVAV
jgi:hypothetical protein